LRPDVSAQWDHEKNKGLSASQVTVGSNRRAHWKCLKGHSWQAQVSARTTKNGTGCPICDNHQVLAGYNDLLTLCPDIAAQWHPTANLPLGPSFVGAGSHSRVWWICEKGHEWRAMIDSRSKRNLGCPYCTGLRAWSGFNDLKTLRPDLASQWHPTLNGDLQPSGVTVGSGSRVWWSCAFGHDWKAQVNNRSGPNSTGCPICTNQKVLAGFNDLQTLCPDVAAEWHPTKNAPLLPAGVLSRTNKRYWWQCAEGHEWRAAVGSRSGGNQSGCPSCARTGFNPAKDGWLYLIENDSLGLLQIGISNRPEARLRDHGSRGWEVVDVRGPMDGSLTQSWEREILDYLRSHGVGIPDPNEYDRFDGYTESWDRQSFPLLSIARIIEIVHQEE